MRAAGGGNDYYDHAIPLVGYLYVARNDQTNVTAGNSGESFRTPDDRISTVLQ
jgi:hypothetical protein